MPSCRLWPESISAKPSGSGLRRDGAPDPQKLLGFTRYDLMMEGFGGHGEWVEDPRDIRPALELTAGSGKPALVNVKVDAYAAVTTQIGLSDH